MLNDEVGNYFPPNPYGAFDSKDPAAYSAAQILVVDPVLGTRFSLVQAATQSGVVVDASASIEDARRQLERTHYALVLVDDGIGQTEASNWLSELKDTSPEVARVLLTQGEGLDFQRHAIVRGGLSLLLTKPLDVASLRRSLREVLWDETSRPGWSRLHPGREEIADVRGRGREEPASALSQRHEVALRGLLAGLNSCESEFEIYELLATELTELLPIRSWRWLDAESGRVTEVSQDGIAAEPVYIDRLSPREREQFSAAKTWVEVTRLASDEPGALSNAGRPALLGFSTRAKSSALHACVVEVEAAAMATGTAFFGGLMKGLGLAFFRVREVKRRAFEARALALRVSEELRTPVGALTHAIDCLRGEVERAGFSTVLVDQVSSESQRLVRAVEHLEGEMLAAPPPTASVAG